jgi:hypothetical protein
MISEFSCLKHRPFNGFEYRSSFGRNLVGFTASKIIPKNGSSLIGIESLKNKKND